MPGSPDQATFDATVGRIAEARLALIEALHQAGGMLLGRNEPQMALRAWREAHALAHPDALGAIGEALRQKRAFLGHDLGHLHLSLREPAAATAPLAEAVAIWRGMSPAPPLLATALGALGAAHEAAGDTLAALGCRREAAALQEAAAARLGTVEARAAHASSVIALGRDLLAAGEAAEAATCLAAARENGLALVSARPAPGLQVLAAAALYHLGRARRDAGETAAALGAFETCAAEMRALLARGHAGVAEDLAEVEAALEALRRSLASGR